MSFFVCILASRKADLDAQERVLPGFTKDYEVKKLVWFEVHEARESAFQRERQIKKNRVWKLELIEKTNPSWRDLYEEIAV